MDPKAAWALFCNAWDNAEYDTALEAIEGLIEWAMRGGSCGHEIDTLVRYRRDTLIALGDRED